MAFKSYRQLESSDCGLVCIRMIANYYGLHLTNKELREKANIFKQGISMEDLKNLAQTMGFRCLPVAIDSEKLAYSAPLPCILYWDKNHYVVLYRTKTVSNDPDKTIFYIADPAQGKLKLKEQDFLKHWPQIEGKGYVLLMEPPDDLERNIPPESKKSIIKEVASSSFKSSTGSIFQLFIGLAVALILQLLFPFLTQAIVDTGIKQQDTSFLVLILLGQLVLIFATVTNEFIRKWILLKLSINVSLVMLIKFLGKLTALPLSFFDTKVFGDILERINDHGRIQSFMTGSLLDFVTSTITIIVFSLVLIYYDFVFFLYFLIGTALYLIWISIFLKKRRRLDYLTFEASAESHTAVLQIVNGMQEIKLTQAEEFKRMNWEIAQVKLYRLQMKSLSLNQIQELGSLIINQTKNVYVTYLVASSVISGNLTLGSMLAIQYIMGQLNGPVEGLIAFVRQFQDAKISANRMDEIYQLDDENVNSELSKLDSQFAAPSLNITNLTFTYPGSSQSNSVFKDLNLQIEFGKTTAIVGRSGSGKTTLIKLILKFYESYSGAITIGDTDLKSIKSESWRSEFGTVLQDGFIFSDTLVSNIVMHQEKVDDLKLQKAIEISNLSEFIARLPLGINTIVGEQGVGLSQGQKQRILIARAIYRNPSFLIFDEATNSLDATNESQIMEKLYKFFENRTVLIIAHRLSTIRKADKIIVLSDGEIKEIGTHSELVLAKSVYWKLVKDQLDLDV